MHKIIIILILLILMVSCSYEKSHDGKAVMDSDGVIYVLEYRIGALYFIKDMTEDIEQARKLIEDF